MGLSKYHDVSCYLLFLFLKHTSPPDLRTSWLVANYMETNWVVNSLFSIQVKINVLKNSEKDFDQILV